jgi:DNA (cytosine-5)-methyltransferase 1
MRVASVFAGCGGGDLGIQGGFKFLGRTYRKRQFSFVHVSDLDVAAVDTYNRNFGHEAIVADVKTVNIGQGEVDLLIGGFPCQSFSTINPSKNPLDDRGLLYNELIRIAQESQPQVVIAENVKGFLTLQKGRFFNDFISKLDLIGYTAHWKVLRASDFGVPQKRDRVFIVAFRKDLDIEFRFPDGIDYLNKKISPPTLNDVIDSLWEVPSKYYFSERAVAGVKAAKPNMKRALAQDLDDSCLTVTSHLAKASLNSRDPVLLVDPAKELYRRFTPLEASRIQGFPDNFLWPETDGKAYRQIGNAISPVVMWHLMNSVEQALYPK